MHGKSLELSSSPRIVGEQCLVAVESTLWSTGAYGAGRGSHPGSPLALRGSRRRPAAPVDGVVVAVESTILRASPGGAPRVLLTLVVRWSRSVHHLRVAPMLAEGPAEEEGTESWQHSDGNSVRHVYTGCRRFPQGWNSAGDGGTVTGVGGRDSGHSRCAAWWPDAA